MWGWIVAILVGALAGWIASMIMGSNAKMGAIANIVVGLLGALLGNFIAGILNLPQIAGGFSIFGVIFAVIGACILIAIVRAVMGGSKSPV